MLNRIIKGAVVCLILASLLSSPVLAQTADQLYDRAVNKYFLGDSQTAISLLKQALEENPQHAKAKSLLAEIQKELGISTPAAPATTVAPRPAPRPTAPAPRPAPRRRTPAKPPVLLQPPSPPKLASMQGTINQLILLILAVIIFAIIVAGRGIYFIIRDSVARSRMQVCPDCKTKNDEKAEFCQVCGTRLKVWSGVTQGQQKWFAKFGWKANPFTLTVNPNLFTGYSSQVKSIMEKVNTRSGHILVYGEKGVGKTTLLRWLTDNLKRDNHAIYIARPPLNFEDMIKLVVDDLRGRRFLGRYRKYSLYEIEGLVKKTKKPVVLLLDEAHEFTAEIEQQMRSLGDIPGINYVLAGLPEAREKIKKDSPPFFDRIVLEVYIDHLDLNDTRDMIKKRIESVGGKDVRPFTDEAIAKVFKMSKGRPRMILKVCDWVTTDAIRNDQDTIGAEAGQDFPAEKALEIEDMKEEPKK